jgi:hypothetical protein
MLSLLKIQNVARPMVCQSRTGLEGHSDRYAAQGVLQAPEEARFCDAQHAVPGALRKAEPFPSLAEPTS